MITRSQRRTLRTRTIVVLIAAVLAAAVIGGCALVALGREQSPAPAKSSATPTTSGSPHKHGDADPAADRPTTSAPGNDGGATLQTAAASTKDKPKNKPKTTPPSTTPPDAVDTQDAKRDLVITGVVSGLLAPGVERPIDVTVTNPNNHAIQIETLTITVNAATTKNGHANPACIGTSNLVVSRSLQGDVIVPKNASRSLNELGIPHSDWPAVTMPNLSVNQDACKNTAFTFDITATARKA
jgi:hypothetical protein